MNIKKIVLSASAAALIGGFAFAPNAQAGEAGTCTEQGRVEGVIIVHGDSPETAGQGCLVAEGNGLGAGPTDDGHIGIYDDGSGTPALYGSCDGRNDDKTFKSFDPAGGGDGAGEACAP